MFGKKTYQEIAINQLITDQDYNRIVRKKWCKIRSKDENFNIHIMKPIDVSLRNDGRMYILDGQNRVEILKLRGTIKTMASIHHDLNYEEEAVLFKALNENNIRVTTYQSFIALVEAKDLIALDILNILGTYDFHIVENDKIQNIEDDDYGKIRGVKLIWSLYNNIGRDDFIKLFDIISKTWGGQPVSLQTELIRGVAVFLRAYEDYKIEKDLINKWKLSPSDVIVTDAKDNFKDTKPGHKYAKELLRIFNSGKAEKNRLPDLIDLVVLNKKSRKITKNVLEEDGKRIVKNKKIMYNNTKEKVKHQEENKYLS